MQRVKKKQGRKAPALIADRKRRLGVACNDDVIQRAHVHQCQRIGQPLGHRSVGRAGFGMSTGMVVREDRRRRVASQGFLDHLARVHRRPVDRAAKHLDVLDQSMLRIDEPLHDAFDPSNPSVFKALEAPVVELKSQNCGNSSLPSLSR